MQKTTIKFEIRNNVGYYFLLIQMNNNCVKIKT